MPKENLLGQLKKACSDDSLQYYSDEQLSDMISLSDQLSQKALLIIDERASESEQTGDDEFMEVIINGQPDLIKKNIEVLNISCNDFTTLPTAFYRLKNLKKLYLFNNRFSPEEKRKIRSSFPPKVQIYF